MEEKLKAPAVYFLTASALSPGPSPIHSIDGFVGCGKAGGPEAAGESIVNVTQRLVGELVAEAKAKDSPDERAIGGVEQNLRIVVHAARLPEWLALKVAMLNKARDSGDKEATDAIAEIVRGLAKQAHTHEYGEGRLSRWAESSPDESTLDSDAGIDPPAEAESTWTPNKPWPFGEKPADESKVRDGVPEALALVRRAAAPHRALPRHPATLAESIFIERVTYAELQAAIALNHVN